MKAYYETDKGKLYFDDCLNVMDYLIEQKIKVDAIITDPPYQSINGLQLTGQKEKVNWDYNFDWNKVWDKINKLIKLNGNIVLFNQMPYALEMIEPNKKDFHHELIWEKNNCAQGMMADIMPLKYHENIYVFRKKIDRELQEWFYQEFLKTGCTFKQFNEEMGFASNGGGVASATFSINKDDWCFPSENFYKKIQNKFPHQFKKNYEEISVKDKPYYGINEKTVIKVAKDMDGLHPTQKPLELIKYLVNVYTKENDLILDFTAGSGTLAYACEQLNRKWICIEKEKKYCNITVERLKMIQQTLF